MGYVDRVLQPGEHVVHRSQLHWLIYGRAIVTLAVALVVAFFAAGISGDLHQVLLYAALVILIVGLWLLVAAFVRRTTTEFAVTDHRIIFKTGVLGRHTIEMNRSKVESVDVDQSLLGRIFGYGTVLVRGTGSSWEPMPHIEGPLALRSSITAN